MKTLGTLPNFTELPNQSIGLVMQSELQKPHKPRGYNKMSLAFGNGTLTNSRNSREIYKYLGVKEKYARWIKRRIDQNGAELHTDYIVIGGDQNDTAKKGDFVGTDYIVTDDFAKHLGMMEKSVIGKQVRNYFIYMEKIATYLLEQRMLECELSTQKIIEYKDNRIKELTVNKMRTYKDGFMSLRRYLRENDINMSEEKAWELLYGERVIETKDVLTARRFLLDDTFGRQEGHGVIEFNSRALNDVFRDFVKNDPSLFD